MKKLIVLAFGLLCFSITFAPVTVRAAEFSEIPITIGPYNLDGLFLMPYGVESSPPVVIFVQGTGQANKDSAFGVITPFKDIAHGLGEQGIASIRFNKRFYQHPPIPVDMTLHTEILEDISYAIHWAANHEGLGDIYLIGLSLGGILAPTIAYQYDEIAGIISLAGSPRHFSEIVVSQSDMLTYMYAQSLGVQLPDGLPIGHMINFVLTADPAQIEATPAINRWAHQWGFPISYLQSLREIDTYAIIDYLNIPMLILHGSEDLQLFVDYDFIAWQELLYGRDNVEFILYEGLNHFFTPHVPELGYWQTMAPARVYFGVIEDIVRWILSF